MLEHGLETNDSQKLGSTMVMVGYLITNHREPTSVNCLPLDCGLVPVLMIEIYTSYLSSHYN